MARKICLSANTAWGMYNFRLGLIRHLQARDYEVHVAVPHDAFTERLSAAGCHIHLISIESKGKNPLKDLASLRQFKALYRALQPDVVIHYTIKPVIYGAFAATALGIPFISVFTGLGSAFSRRTFVTRIAEVLYRWSQRKAHAVFFLNQEDCAAILRLGLVPRATARTIPGEGIDLDHFRALKPDASDAESRHEGATVFLFAGRLLWEKGVGDFVDAARKVRQLRPEMRFQLLGPCGVDNDSAISLEQVHRWEKEGVITYLGAAADVRPHIRAADCVVLPSFYREGVPRILMEAAALGRPVITTRMPGCRDVVAEGVSGFLVPPRDVKALAQACLTLASMSTVQQRAMGQAGLDKMRREFDQRLVVAAYEEVIEAASASR
jgi:glycosyltransferase involved in cell wall biosynthesis